jgi:SAM-dependent methyltransferase
LLGARAGGSAERGAARRPRRRNASCWVTHRPRRRSLNMDYAAIYTKQYFSGETSFFYRFGYGRFARFYFDALVRPLLPHLRVIERGNVLDVGCAYGLVLARVPDGLHKFGIDVSEHAIEEAARRVPDADLRIGNAERELPFPSDFFDVVTCNDVIEHLENPERALANIHRVLKPGGVLYLNTPNLNALRRTLYRRADAMEHHVSLFSHDALVERLTGHGFEIIDAWSYTDLTFFFFTRLPGWLGVESGFICTKAASPRVAR